MSVTAVGKKSHKNFQSVSYLQKKKKKKKLRRGKHGEKKRRSGVYVSTKQKFNLPKFHDRFRPYN